MKIKKFKLTPWLKEVYLALKRSGVQLTPEVETAVALANKAVAAACDPSIVAETFELTDAKMVFLKEFLKPPKNASRASFVAATLGPRVETLAAQEPDALRRQALEAVLQEYVDAAGRFILKVLQEQQAEPGTEPGSAALLPQELYSQVFPLLDPAKIGIAVSDNALSPKYTTAQYLLWFTKKK